MFCLDGAEYSGFNSSGTDTAKVPNIYILN
jgi:hypothetical protein